MLYLYGSSIIESGMLMQVTKGGIMDRMGIALSGLCLVHCLASTVFFALLASAGGLLVMPLVHEVGLTLAICMGILSLGRGVVDHGFMMPSAIGGLGLGTMGGALTLPHGTGAEILYTIVGVALLALGHDLNRRAAI
jgi:hypothetical protein